MAPRPETLYPVDERLYRPLEHVVESLSCHTLERLTGRGHSWWHAVKRGVYEVPSPVAERLYGALEQLDPSAFYVVDALRNPQENRRKTYRLVPRPVPPKRRREVNHA